MFQNNILKEIKNKLNIVEIIGEYINIIKKGNNYWTICPFHNDSKPSMSISESKQMFNCFVCHKGGDIFKFVSEFKNISFADAIKLLAKKANINYKFQESNQKYSDKKQRQIDILNEALFYFKNNFFIKENEQVRKYVQNRQLNEKIIEKFNIGYAPFNGIIDFLVKKGYKISEIINARLSNDGKKDFFKKRLIFPIKNEYGDVIAFSGRIITKDDNFKYLNSAESLTFLKNETFYNIDNAIDHIKKNQSIYICEGFMDVIALFETNFKNSVCIMGTSLTHNHIKKLLNLKIKEINLVFDGDQAGIDSTKKSLLLLKQYNLKTFVINIPINQDPYDIYLKDKNILKKLIDNKISANEFIVLNFLKKKEQYKIENINDELIKINKFLKFDNEIIKKHYLKMFEKELKIDYEELNKIFIVYNRNYGSQKQEKIKLVDPFEFQQNITTMNLIYILLKQPKYIKEIKKHQKWNIKKIVNENFRYIIEMIFKKDKSILNEIKKNEKKEFVLLKFFININKNNQNLKLESSEDLKELLEEFFKKNEMEEKDLKFWNKKINPKI